MYKCDHDETEFFVQVACLQKREFLEKKKLIGLIIACIGVFGCFVFWVLLIYMPDYFDINSFNSEIKTVRAHDYTVELNLTK